MTRGVLIIAFIYLYAYYYFLIYKSNLPSLPLTFTTLSDEDKKWTEWKKMEITLNKIDKDIYRFNGDVNFPFNFDSFAKKVTASRSLAKSESDSDVLEIIGKTGSGVSQQEIIIDFFKEKQNIDISKPDEYIKQNIDWIWQNLEEKSAIKTTVKKKWVRPDGSIFYKTKTATDWFPIPRYTYHIIYPDYTIVLVISTGVAKSDAEYHSIIDTVFDSIEKRENTK